MNIVTRIPTEVLELQQTNIIQTLYLTDIEDQAKGDDEDNSEAN